LGNYYFNFNPNKLTSANVYKTLTDPDTDSKTYDDTYGTIKTFKGGYSSEDKDAHLRPPPTYNYELIDDEDGEGKFEQPQGQENETFKEKNEPEVILESVLLNFSVFHFYAWLFCSTVKAA
jgi:hypothetical protein